MTWSLPCLVFGSQKNPISFNKTTSSMSRHGGDGWTLPPGYHLPLVGFLRSLLSSLEKALAQMCSLPFPWFLWSTAEAGKIFHKNLPNTIREKWRNKQETIRGGNTARQQPFCPKGLAQICFSSCEVERSTFLKVLPQDFPSRASWFLFGLE